jgi:hypothetical protein
VEWDVANSYHADDLVYWPVTGEVYKSKINNNLGHEPDDVLLANQSPLNVEETQPFAPPSPGSPEVNAIWEVPPTLVNPPSSTIVNGIYSVISSVGGVTIPAHPAAGTVFSIKVYDASNVLLGQGSVTADGTRDRANIWATLAANLENQPGLASFLIGYHSEGTNTVISIEHPSAFTIVALQGTSTALDTRHDQTYVPGQPSPFSDPPPNGSVFKIEVRDATNALLGDGIVTANGTNSLSVIFAALRTQLLAEPGLAGFVAITINEFNEIILEDNSQFTVTGTWTWASVVYQLWVNQFSAYSPAIPPSPSQPQILRLAITEQQVLVNATYTLTFITGDSAEHTVTYIASRTDNALAILNGLVNAMITAQDRDPFFAGVTSVLDSVGLSVTFTMNVSLGETALSATLQPPGTAFWDIIHFPFALMDQVVRGAYADALAEQGQTDKATAQEQVVPIEQQVRAGGELAPQYQTLSDQQQQRSRYQVK